jgi:hypothetical protein
MAALERESNSSELIRCNFRKTVRSRNAPFIETLAVPAIGLKTPPISYRRSQFSRAPSHLEPGCQK